jgi:hypothetical protein
MERRWDERRETLLVLAGWRSLIITVLMPQHEVAQVYARDRLRLDGRKESLSVIPLAPQYL